MAINEGTQGEGYKNSRKSLDYPTLVAVIGAKERVKGELCAVRYTEADEGVIANPALEKKRKRLKRELDRTSIKIIALLSGLESRHLKVLFSRIREMRNIEGKVLSRAYASTTRYFKYVELLYGDFQNAGIPNDKTNAQKFLNTELYYPELEASTKTNPLPDIDHPEYAQYEAKLHFQRLTGSLLEYLERKVKEFSQEIEESILPGIFDKEFAIILRDMDRVRLSGGNTKTSDIDNPELKLQGIVDRLEQAIKSMEGELFDRIRYFEQHIEDRLLSRPTEYYANKKRYAMDVSEIAKVKQFFR